MAPWLRIHSEFFSLVLLQKQHTLRAHKQDCVLNFDLCDVVPLVALGSLKSTNKTEALYCAVLLPRAAVGQVN